MTIEATHPVKAIGRVANGPLRRGIRFSLSNSALAFADQCAVSGLAFLILVAMGAFTTLVEIGAFALAMSVVALALATQDATITRPYTIQSHTPVTSAQGHLSASMRLALILAGVIFVVTMAIGVAQCAIGRLWEGQITMALALTIPGSLLREFARRISFAHERSIDAVLMDAPVVGFALIGIVALGFFGHLTAATALLTLAITNFAGGFGWILAKGLGRPNGAIPTAQVAETSWTMGRWLFLSQIAMQAQGYTTHWLALLFLGASATGVYATCLSIIAFSNPVLQGLFNIMIPKSAKMFQQSGNQGVIRLALRDSAVLVALMLVFCFFIALFGERVMSLLYPATSNTGHLLIVLALSSLVATAGVPASMALASANKAANLAVVVCLAALVNLAIVLLLVPWGGLIAAAYGTLLAEFVGTIGRWVALCRTVDGSSTTSAITKQDVGGHA